MAGDTTPGSPSGRDTVPPPVHPNAAYPHPVEGPPLPSPQAPSGSSSRRTCIILGLVGGCGCLLILAIIAILAGGLAWFTSKIEPPAPVGQVGAPADVSEPPAPMNPAAPPTGVPAPETEELPQPPPPQSAGPGEAAAIRAALEAINEPSWVTRVEEHSDDWRLVTIWAGPPQSEYVYKVIVEWDDGLAAYILQHMSELPSL